MIAAFDVGKFRPKISKVSGQDHCHKGCVLMLPIFELAICDMIKKQKRGDMLIWISEQCQI